MSASEPEEEQRASPDRPSSDEAFDQLPPALRKALSKPGVSPGRVQKTIEAFAEPRNGPLPSVEQLRSYDKVLPGSADRILRMAESQQAHRIEMERTIVREADKPARYAMWLGFGSAALAVALGGVAICTGHDPVEFSLLLTQAATLAGVFVYGRDRQRKERIYQENPV